MALSNNEGHYTQAHTLLEVFCSYAPADEPLMQNLSQHLAPLQRAGFLTLRHRGQIKAGNDYAEAIQGWLARASVIVLLVSPAYLASDTCYEEATQAMQCSAHIIPVILRPCDWGAMPFAGLQCLPCNGQAITTWDNEDLAWQEVVKGIRLVLDEGPLKGVVATAQTAGQPRIWNLPFARNPFFTGREDELQRLHSQLSQNRSTAIGQKSAISGLGGIGKTQLAVEYAYRYQDEYQFVFWARADTTELLNASYAEIAAHLKLRERNKREPEVIVQAVHDWLQATPNWLLILDNADDLDVVAPFLPQVVRGHLLLTTRASALGAIGITQPLLAETFSPTQGAYLLLKRAGLLAPGQPLESASEQDRKLALGQSPRIWEACLWR